MVYAMFCTSSLDAALYLSPSGCGSLSLVAADEQQQGFSDLHH